MNRVRGTRGIALVIVLTMIVLLTIIVLSFYFSVSTERVSVSAYHSNVLARQLADTAVNVVISQIREATTQGGNASAWASQPGGIRTFTTDGKQSKIFKLYSSDQLVLSDQAALGFDPAEEGHALEDWGERPSFFTDLNQPVLEENPTGEIVVDGVSYRAAYPILNPATQAEGFEISNTGPAKQYAGLYPPESNYNPILEANPAPMPAMWLYMLEDGTLVAPQGGSGRQAAIAGATKANPIVGRVAFWTDDETAKVNINTASEGRFWDIPRHREKTSSPPYAPPAGADTEGAYAKFQPVAREYNRYPGHPATTSLSAVFNKLVQPAGLTPEEIFTITPRVQFGGSRMGTVASISPMDPAADTDRLYATIDELLFRPNRTENPVLNRSHVENASFFLTTTGRAPETNIFNQPRISMWPIYNAPIDSNSPYQTTLDRLLAFCSTINGRPYYFQREDSRSPTSDYNNIARNMELFSYLRDLCGRDVPGYGRSFVDKYGLEESDQILTEIFDYVRTTNLRDSQLDENHQYSRALYKSTNPDKNKNGVNYERNPGKGEVIPITIANPGGHKTMGFGRFAVVSEVGIWFVALGRGQNTIDPAPGPVSANHPDNALPVHPNQPFTAVPPAHGRTPPPNTTAVLAIPIFNLVSPSVGWTSYNPGFTIRVKGLEDFELNGEPLLFPAADAKGPSAFCQELYTWGSALWGGALGAAPLLAYKDLDRGPDDPDRYPFRSNILYVPHQNADGTLRTMAFKGGEIEIEIYEGNQTSFGSDAEADPRFIQRYRLKIPDGTFPVPKLSIPAGQPSPMYDRRTMIVGSSASEFEKPAKDPSIPHTKFTTYMDRLDRVLDERSTAYKLIDPHDVEQDVVKGYLLDSGDFRMLFRRTVDDTAIPFRVPSTWNDEKIKLSNSFFMSSGGDFPGATRGSIIDGLVAPASCSPLIPGHINGIFIGGDSDSELRGDWDNAFGRYRCGPYINKADEGTIANLTIDGMMPHFSSHMDDFEEGDFEAVGAGMFSPNRLIPSPAMLGSLPSGLWHNRPWQNLLFRPAPTSSVAPVGHPGQAGRKWDGTLLPGAPPDHMLLDFFWMPVVEPYPISEPFSTAGKINLNTQILPYSNFLKRDTGLHAVLKSERIAGIYRDNYKTSTAVNPRHSINLSGETGAIRQIQERFDSGRIFLSASEICEVFLPPSDSNWPTDDIARSNWYGSAFRYTGDNTRERPYASIYPRVTTRSNTYTVHYRVQTLKKVTGGSLGVFDEDRDQVTGELRGSAVVERYVDPNDPSIPDFTAEPARTLDPHYNYRILSIKQFPR